MKYEDELGELIADLLSNYSFKVDVDKYDYEQRDDPFYVTITDDRSNKFVLTCEKDNGKWMMEQSEDCYEEITLAELFCFMYFELRNLEANGRWQK